MPPFVPSKRQSSEDPPHPKRHATTATTSASSPQSPCSDSSLTPVPTDVDNDPEEEGKKDAVDSDAGDSDEIDWEDAIHEPAAPATSFVSPQENLELTLDRNEVHLEDIARGQKAPSKIERQIRILIHRLHVQCLLAHNALRNDWANDGKCHDILRNKLPPAIQNEVKKWRRASGLEPPEPPKEPPPQTKKGRRNKRQAKSQQRDWGENSSRQEPGEPDMSNGDPIIHLMRILAAYWKSKFKITAPGLRKHGYRPMSQLQSQIASFHHEEYDAELYGERISNVEEFREAAEHMEGSRDLGAQLFTALLRALSMEARLVASLQPLGFGWTKAESDTPSKTKEKAHGSEKAEADGDDAPNSDDEDEDEEKVKRSRARKSQTRLDQDLPFPIYWTEVASPITHQVVSVDPLVLPNPVAATQELQAGWEPRGAKAEKAKQVICYVVAFSADRTAKEVTTRYLRRRTWPGKTKGFRLGKKGPDDDPLDWFRACLRVYKRPYKDRTAVDDIEDAQDLVPNRPTKSKPTNETVDTLQSLRTSTEFVLERFLRREEALRPGAQPVRTFIPGGKSKTKNKGAATPTENPKAENVYRRVDIVKCHTAESWHKEGREPRPSAVPLKRVPIRAVTLLRKREVDDHARRTGEKPLQGLYSLEQTQAIIPPPIVDGIIPKNDYGNIDCFVPTMVPEGAVHIPFPGTARMCKKLGIDYAEAVTGFEFGSQMAVPVIEGVVVAVENEDLVKDAWRADNEEKRRREARKAEAKILQTWRKFLFGMRIAQRVQEEYAEDETGHLPDAHNPFASSKASATKTQTPSGLGTGAETGGAERPAGLADEEENVNDRGGGFLLDGDDGGDDGDLIVEGRRPPMRRAPKISHSDESPDEDLSPEEEEDLEDESPPPQKRRRTRTTRRS